MSNETLKTQSQAPALKYEPVNYSGVLNEQQINQLKFLRKQLLENIKNQISLKAFYSIEEKIESEEKRLKEILDLKQGRMKKLSKYSFILDTRFFEQEFLN